MSRQRSCLKRVSVPIGWNTLRVLPAVSMVAILVELVGNRPISSSLDSDIRSEKVLGNSQRRF